MSDASPHADFLDVLSVVPDAVIDLRYGTEDNFIGTPLYPAGTRCVIHKDLADGLRTAAEELRKSGEVLVFWDGYRPYDVQVQLFNAMPNPKWVAEPCGYARNHTAGRSVDVTLARRDAPAGELVDMGTDFDDFTPRSLAYATEGLTDDQQENRQRLRAAMRAGGFRVYEPEWWHFDGPGAAVPRPLIVPS
nr:M15 family metallopeptidase [Mycolicibacterium palauense]